MAGTAGYAYSAGYTAPMGVSTVGMGPLGVSGVGVAMGTTTIAPTIYEKAIVQDIPSTHISKYSRE
jgi:hypothetical protein